MKTRPIALAFMLIATSAIVLGLSVECVALYGIQMLGLAIFYVGACFLLTASLTAWFGKD